MKKIGLQRKIEMDRWGRKKFRSWVSSYSETDGRPQGENHWEGGLGGGKGSNRGRLVPGWDNRNGCKKEGASVRYYTCVKCNQYR